jgi:hypothetical protein
MYVLVRIRVLLAESTIRRLSAVRRLQLNTEESSRKAGLHPRQLPVLRVKVR